MAKQYPSGMYTFVVADAVRQEAGGKVSILGAFAAGQILIPLKSEFPAAFPLAFYVVFRDGLGDFEAKIRILGVDGKPMMEEASVGRASAQPGKGLQIIVNFLNWITPAEGTYKTQIMLDDHIYEDAFSVHRGEPTA